MVRFVLALGFAVFASVGAFAQTAQTTAANSGSNAYAIIQQGGASSGTQRIVQSVETVPSMLGSLAVAPCTTAAQVGGAFLGGGFTASLGSESEGCARRANAAAFHALGRDDIALALLAQDPTVARAVETVRKNNESKAKEQAVVVAAPRTFADYCRTMTVVAQQNNVNCH
jgi:hypothetical protein